MYLVNDPDFEAVPGEDAYGKFGGKAATYYARWTYKYEEAARRGAVAALIVHETEPAAYGWITAIAPNGEGYDIVRADPAKEKLLLQSWLHRDAAVEILRGAGLDFEALKKSARSKAFQPVELRDATFAADFPLAHARIDSHNVIGKITGVRYPSESIMVGGHWDAYGSGEPDANGLRFRAGALDDAIGIAGAIEIARAFKQGPRPDRTHRVLGMDRRRTRACWDPSTTRTTRGCRSRPPSPISRWTCCSRTASRATSCWSAPARTSWIHCWRRRPPARAASLRRTQSPSVASPSVPITFRSPSAAYPRCC